MAIATARAPDVGINDDIGEETRLTDVKGLDDGPEYSPDGRYIYFNSTRSGKMQLWRMKPDGKDPEPVTDDEHNNWFPHLSPDGRRIAFLSYGNDVAPAAASHELRPGRVRTPLAPR